jgi:hypothetical protein
MPLTVGLSVALSAQQLSGSQAVSACPKGWASKRLLFSLRLFKKTGGTPRKGTAMLKRA